MGWTALTLALAAAAVSAGLWIRTRERLAAAEAELRETNSRVERSVEARETFFDLVTHELRSPLSAILGYQELLVDGAYGPLGEDAREAAARIGVSARQLLHLIDGVVELSQLRAGSLQPRRGAVDLGVVLSTAAESFETQAHHRGIPADISLPDSIPTIQSDQGRLVRAIDLLSTSVIKHPAKDGIRFAVNVAGDDEADRVDVVMDGVDIALASAENDPAVRLGLRLAIAARIATLLGGELTLDIDHSGGDERVRSLTFTITSLPPA